MLLLDIEMGAMDGITMMRQLRKNNDILFRMHYYKKHNASYSVDFVGNELTMPSVTTCFRRKVQTIVE